MRSKLAVKQLSECSFSPTVPDHVMSHPFPDVTLPRPTRVDRPRSAELTGGALIAEADKKFLDSLREHEPKSTRKPSKFSYPSSYASQRLSYPLTFSPSPSPLSNPPMSPSKSSLLKSFKSLKSFSATESEMRPVRRRTRRSMAPIRAARMIQRLWMLFVFRKRIRCMRVKISKIQAAWRGKRTRETIRHELKRQMAAAMIQRIFIRWMYRRSRAAIFLQKWWRVKLAEKNVVDMALLYFSKRVEKEKIIIPVLEISSPMRSDEAVQVGCSSARIRSTPEKPVQSTFLFPPKKLKGVIDFSKNDVRQDKRIFLESTLPGRNRKHATHA